MAPRKDFIGFILDAEKDTNLSRTFLSIRNPQKLESFFTDNEYEIDLPTCEYILKSKTMKNWITKHAPSKKKEKGSPREGGKIPVPCPKGAHY